MMLIAILIPVAAFAADLSGPLETHVGSDLDTPVDEIVLVPQVPKVFTTTCTQITNVNPDYIPYAQAAAAKWLGGDTNILYALIQVESKWDASAKNRVSSASGLGQFITGTARGYTELTGGSDVMRRGKKISAAPERIWEPATVFDDPKSHFPEDARFNPERAIFAVAHKMSGALSGGRSLLDAYAVSYHGFNANDERGRSIAYGAGNKFVSVYKQLEKNGGCQIIEKK